MDVNEPDPDRAGHDLQALLDNMPDLIYFKDTESRFIRVNRACAGYLGLADPRDAIGKSDADFFPAVDACAYRTEERHLLTTGEALIGKPGSHVGIDGQNRWVLTNKVPIRDHDGRIIGLFGIAHDITDLKKIEDDLRQSEQRHRELLAEARRQAQKLALFEEVRTALARELELPDLIRTVVEAIARTFGYTLVSLYLLEDNVLVLQHQVGYDQVAERIPLMEGVSGRSVRTGEAVLLEDVRADPAFISAIPGIVSEVCVPLRDAGKVVGTLNVESRDEVRLTEADLNLMVALSEHVNVTIGRARLYTELRRSETRFRALVQNTADMISLVDARGIRMYASPAYERILGYRPEDLVGQPIDAIVHPDDAGIDRRVFAEIAERPFSLERFEARVRHRDGSDCWLEVIAVNRLTDPEVRGIVVTSRDITERKAADAERLRRARHASLRADVSSVLAERETLPSMLRRCARALVSHLDAGLAQIWLLDEQSQVLELRASAGLTTRLDDDQASIPIGRHRLGRIAQEGQPYLTNDLASDPHADMR